MDPDLVVIVAGIVACCVGVPLARALASRIAAPAPRALLPSQLAERLDRIERAVEAVSVEVERIGEGQRFTTQLLAGRTGDPPAQAGGGSPPYRPPS